MTTQNQETIHSQPFMLMRHQPVAVFISLATASLALLCGCSTQKTEATQGTPSVGEQPSSGFAYHSHTYGIPVLDLESVHHPAVYSHSGYPYAPFYWNNTRVSRMNSPYLYHLSESNEAAINVIASRLVELTNKTRVDKLYQAEETVLVSTMVNLENLDVTSGFGRLLSEQYSAALLEHRVKVKEIRRSIDLIEVEPEKGEFALSRHAPKIAQDMSADYILAGVYRPMRTVVYVNVKLISSKDSVVVESVDYGIPINDLVRDLLRNPRQERIIQIRSRSNNPKSE